MELTINNNSIIADFLPLLKRVAVVNGDLTNGLHPSNIKRCFDNYAVIAEFYADPAGAIVNAGSECELKVLEDAKQLEVHAFLLKRLLSLVADSGKKPEIAKYFTEIHFHSILQAIRLSAKAQSRLWRELSNRVDAAHANRQMKSAKCFFYLTRLIN